MARTLCMLAAIPESMTSGPVEVHIDANDRRERWTRRFGNSRPMQSTLRRKGNRLTERIGPTSLAFQLREHEGGIDWQLTGISVLGIPLPQSCLDITARCGARAGYYSFFVDVQIPGVGRLIRYEGELDTTT